MRPLWAVLLMLAWFGGAALLYWLATSPPCPRIVIEGLSVRCVP